MGHPLVFGIYMPIYAGGCFISEPADAVQSAYLCANLAIRMCGLTLGKFAPPSHSLLLLGACVTISSDFVSAALPITRRGALIAELSGILESGRLMPGHAAKIRRRLGFPQSLMFGEFGRVIPQYFTSRQYPRAIRGKHLLDKELREVPLVDCDPTCDSRASLVVPWP